MIPNKNLGAGDTWGAWVQDEISSINAGLNNLGIGGVRNSLNGLMSNLDNTNNKLSFRSLTGDLHMLGPNSNNVMMAESVMNYPENGRGYLNFLFFGSGRYVNKGTSDAFRSKMQLVLQTAWTPPGGTQTKYEEYYISQMPGMFNGEINAGYYDLYAFYNLTVPRVTQVVFRLIGENRLTNNPEKDEYNYFNGTILVLESNQPNT
uniref:Uncharacterized protein n=1 Tax=Siphoviridae sp. ctjKY6 TaxID=2825631 RepID=A0A8S5UY68_9CAUD|nr:MAG TPA: hypothetical protein [Siphoviridae sp. ctjKY6]